MPDIFKKNKLLIFSCTLYLMAVTTRLFSFWIPIDPFEQKEDSANFLVTIIGNASALYFIAYLWNKRSGIFNIVKWQWPITLMILYALLSCAWSESPTIALRRWLKVAFFFSLIISLVVSNDPMYNIRKVISLYGKIAITLSLIFIIFLPEYGWMSYDDKILPMGIYAHKGLLGQFSAFILLLFLMLLRGKDRIFWSLAAIILLLLSETKGALISLLISLIILSYIKIDPALKHNKLNSLLASFFLLLAIYTGMFAIVQKEPFSSLFEYILPMIGKDSTLTGRTLMWEALLDMGMKHPLTGVGFRTFFNGTNTSLIMKYLHWNSSNAHNGFLQAFLEVGLIGVLFFINNIIWVGFVSFKFLKENNYRVIGMFPISILLMYLFSNFSSDCFLGDKFCVFAFLLIPNLIKSYRNDF